MRQTAGIILCGGESSRMGRPKAWLPCVVETMLERVTRLLGAAVSPLVVVAAPDQDLPPLPTDVAVARDPERGRGPLQGLATGLEALIGRSDQAFVSSCDVPFLRPAFVELMTTLLGRHQIAVPDVGGYRHPLAAVYRVEVLAAVRRLLAEGRMRPAFLFEEVPTRFVTESELALVDPGLQSLRNLNTPEEYAAALREMTMQSQP